MRRHGGLRGETIRISIFKPAELLTLHIKQQAMHLNILASLIS